MPAPTPSPRALFLWIGAVYLASGAPLAIVTDALPAAYKAAKIDLAALGLLALAELPWTLKFLWAPLVDRFGRRRSWARATQAILASLLVALSFLPPDAIGATTWVVMIGVAAASATQDVALDGWVVDAVPPERTGPANGLRVSSYRVGTILGGGVVLWSIDAAGWASTWRIAALAFAGCAVATSFLPERPRSSALQPALLRRQVRDAFLGLLGRPAAAAFLAFVLVFKIGDYAMARMTKPALQDAGFTLSEVGQVNTFTVLAVLAGALLGGLWTQRWGLFRALWVLGLLQAASNLAYAGAAALWSREAFWVAAIIEPFCSGLGTAPFLALLMRSCQPAHAATQFALLTAIMGLGRTAAGTVSGWLAQRLGYAPWFALTFLIALPAFALLPAVRRWLEGTRAR